MNNKAINEFGFRRIYEELSRSRRVTPSSICLKGRDHGYAHARRLSLQNKFVGSTQFEIAITGTIIENPSFYSDIRRSGWPSYTSVVLINVSQK